MTIPKRGSIPFSSDLMMTNRLLLLTFSEKFFDPFSTSRSHLFIFLQEKTREMSTWLQSHSSSSFDTNWRIKIKFHDKNLNPDQKSFYKNFLIFRCNAIFIDFNLVLVTDFGLKNACFFKADDIPNGFDLMT